MIAMPSKDVLDVIADHPCYDEKAHRKYARMHLPVAPACNIQCNYCNRKYDCTNESRPGVTSEVLSPQEAVDKVGTVLDKIPYLKVIGIAGPGDPMANEATFESIEKVREKYPDLIYCISTNGLALPQNVQRLYDLGVRFVTITMNAVDPEVGAKVYEYVRLDGKVLRGVEAAKALLERQLKGLEMCVALGMAVKINVVMIPGVNLDHIPELVKKVKEMGAYSVNILPLIPVEGTAFQDMDAPTPEMRKDLMDRCEGYGINIMRHCKQCRADAIGLLENDRSQEFSKEFACGSCRPSEPPLVPTGLNGTIAIASDGGEEFNCGFGNAPSFYLFGPGEAHRLIGKVDIDTSVPVSGSEHRQHIADIISSLNGAGTVVVSEIGPYPLKVLAGLGVKVTVAHGSISDYLDTLHV